MESRKNGKLKLGFPQVGLHFEVYIINAYVAHSGTHKNK
jgi:hypothetical protein